MRTCIKTIYPIVEEFSSQSRLGSTVSVQERRVRKQFASKDNSSKDAVPIRRSKRTRTQRACGSLDAYGGVCFSDEEELSEYLEEDSEWFFDEDE